MNYIDLHVHSTFSDGSCTPEQLIKLAEEKGLSHIALTDHDTVDGIPYAAEAAKCSPVVLIPGIELSSDYNNKDVHIVGLGIDYKNSKFSDHLRQFQKDRFQRNEKICNKLIAAGYKITYDELKKAFPDAILTRCHIARMLQDKGYVKSIAEAFDTIIGSHCPCYVPRTRITPAKAVTLIKEAGGVAILAHPMLYHMDDQHLCQLIEQLKQYGLDAIEAIYSCNQSGDEQYVRSLAQKYDLAISGGSDFHGSNKPDIDLGSGKGNILIPEDLLKQPAFSGL